MSDTTAIAAASDARNSCREAFRRAVAAAEGVVTDEQRQRGRDEDARLRADVEREAFDTKTGIEVGK